MIEYAFAEFIIDMKLLSSSETKEAFLLHCKLMKCLHDLPDIRKSKATEQIWQDNSNLWIMFKTCTALLEWASQNKVERRLVQTQAARLQV